MSTTTRKIEARDMSHSHQLERLRYASELKELGKLVSEKDCRLVVRSHGEEVAIDETVHELVRLATIAGLYFEQERLRHDCFIDNKASKVRFYTFLEALEVVRPLGDEFSGENWLRAIPWNVEILHDEPRA